MATYGYRRVSSETQEEGTSLDDQTKKITAMATIAGLEEPIFFEDVCSGSIPLDKRNGGAELLSSLQRGDSVIVSKLDRCFRDATDALSRADWFKEKGINLYLIDMGTEPVTNNGASRMFFGMLALVAEFERTRIKERLADGRTGKKAKGGHIGGTRPFGYDVEGSGKNAVLRPRDDEQEAIREMVALKAAGKSSRAISEVMKAKGFNVSHTTVNDIIKKASQSA